MKKNICKLFSLLLVSVICLSASVYAIDGSASAAATTVMDSQREMVDELFAKDFTMLNVDGKDITEEFYATMTPAYRMGDYETVLEYLRANMDQAKCVEQFPYQIHADNDSELITMYKSNTIEITDTETGRENNRFQYTLKVKYYYSEDRDIITGSQTPTLADYGFLKDFGDENPTIKMNSFKCQVATSGAYLTCSFNYDFTFRVNVEGDPLASAIRYHYKGSTSVRVNAGER